MGGFSAAHAIVGAMITPALLIMANCGVETEGKRFFLKKEPKTFFRWLGVGGLNAHPKIQKFFGSFF
jgi:hypothetical protein